MNTSPCVNNLCLMKCCPLWSDVEQQSRTITKPRAPIAFGSSLCFDMSGLRDGAETDHRCESRWNRMQTSLEGKLLWKSGWHQEAQLPEETALETLNFNKITNLGRARRRRRNSMCRLELAAWNTDLWTPLNHISFSLLGPAAFTQCGKKG